MRNIALLGAALACLASPALAQRGGDWFATADADRDGVVIRDEFVRYRDGNFGRLDRNGDGVVTRDDFSRIARLRPEAGKRLAAMIAQADANRDGKLTRAELAAAPTPIFDRADGNGDGSVSKAEAEAAKAMLRQAAGGH